jgi:hypothetical protein
LYSDPFIWYIRETIEHNQSIHRQSRRSSSDRSFAFMNVKSLQIDPWQRRALQIAIFDVIVSVFLYVLALFTFWDSANVYLIFQATHVIQWLVGFALSKTYDRPITTIACVWSALCLGLDLASIGVRMAGMITCSPETYACSGFLVKNMFVLILVALLSIGDGAQLVVAIRIRGILSRLTDEDRVSLAAIDQNEMYRPQQGHKNRPPPPPQSPYLTYHPVPQQGERDRQQQRQDGSPKPRQQQQYNQTPSSPLQQISVLPPISSPSTVQSSFSSPQHSRDSRVITPMAQSPPMLKM